MAVDAGDVYVDVHARSEGLQKQIESDVGGAVEKSGGAIGGAAKKLGLAIGGAFAAGFALDAVKGAIGAASDLNEIVSKSNTIFGPAGKAIEDWANTAATNFGQTKAEALGAAGTFGNLFTQLGIGTDKAAGMSTQMVELASDFASFHNAAPVDVLEAMTAAFRGEFDAVQRFVPTINAANVQEKAMAMGLAKTTKELDEQDKALATQALLMEGAGAAMGDFDRTSDSLANRQRILSARLADMRAEFGAKLLPVMTAAVGIILNQVLPAFSKFTAFLSDTLAPVFQWVGDSFKLLIGAFTGAGADVDLEPKWMNRLIDTGATLREMFDELVGGFRAFIAAFKAGDGDITSSGFAGTMERIGAVARDLADEWLPRLQTALGFVVDHWREFAVALGLLFAPITTIAVGLGVLYVKSETFRDIVNGLGKIVAEQFQHIADAIGDLAQWWEDHTEQMSEAWGHIVVATKFVLDLLADLWDRFGGRLMKIVELAFERVRIVIGAGMAILREVIELVMALINGDWGEAWQSLKEIPLIVLRTIVALIKNSFQMIYQIVQIAMNALWALTQAAWNGIVILVNGAWQKIWQAVKDAAKKVAEAAVAVWNAVKDAAVDKWEEIKQSVVDAWNAVVDFFKNAGPAIWQQMQFIWDQILLFATERWENLKQNVINAWNAIVDFFKGVPEGLVLIFKTIWDAVIDFIKLEWEGITRIVTGAWDAIVTFFTEAGPNIWDAIVNIWQEVGRKERELLEDMKQGVSDAIGAIPGIITGLAGQVLEAAKSIGSSIVDGIIQGITGVGKAALNAAQWALDFANEIKKVINREVIDRINKAVEFQIPLPFGAKFDVNPKDIPQLPTYGGGGVVPGAQGVEQLIRAHGGEVVFTPDQMRALGKVIGGGGVSLTVSVSVSAAPGADARAIGDTVAASTTLAVRHLVPDLRLAMSGG